MINDLFAFFISKTIMVFNLSNLVQKILFPFPNIPLLLIITPLHFSPIPIEIIEYFEFFFLIILNTYSK